MLHPLWYRRSHACIYVQLQSPVWTFTCGLLFHLQLDCTRHYRTVGFDLEGLLPQKWLHQTKTKQQYTAQEARPTTLWRWKAWGLGQPSLAGRLPCPWQEGWSKWSLRFLPAKPFCDDSSAARPSPEGITSKCNQAWGHLMESGGTCRGLAG